VTDRLPDIEFGIANTEPRELDRATVEPFSRASAPHQMWNSSCRADQDVHRPCSRTHRCLPQGRRWR
jgi:hypothetical protein